MELEKQYESLKKTFESGILSPYENRLENLNVLEKTIRRREDEIFIALKEDLGKSREEAYATELGIAYSEIRYVRKHLRKWMKDKKVPTGILHFPSSSRILKEPIGNVLIMSPWNYPVQLTLIPLVGAIAAGCSAMVKPSRYSNRTSKTLSSIIEEAFHGIGYIGVEGGRDVNNALLDLKWDHIFFTGSPNVGRIVMMKAASTLTPCTLELGGKSPVIVDETAKLDVAARRLTFAKLINAGQTCVAPDYVLAHKSIARLLVGELEKNAHEMYGDKPLENEEYPHIINEKHFERLTGLLESTNIAFGGNSDARSLKMEPTAIYPASEKDYAMQEEIFGPILPIIEYENIDDAIEFIRKRPHPLALYIYSENKVNIERALREVRFGGGCVNDSLMHLVSHHLPFGGIGESGTGSYHGKKTFDVFTHEKSVLSHSSKIDIRLRNAPMKGKEKLFRSLLR